MSRYTLHVHADQLFQVVEIRATLIEQHDDGSSADIAHAAPAYYDAGDDPDPLGSLAASIAAWAQNLSGPGRISATQVESR